MKGKVGLLQFLVVIVISLLFCCCQSDEAKKEGIIKDYISENIVNMDSILNLEILHKDSIQDYPCDPSILIQAEIVNDKISDLESKIAQFIEYSNISDSIQSLTVESLNLQGKEAYDKMIESNTEKEEASNKLHKLISEFKPVPLNRSIINLKYQSNDTIKDLFAIFYFDEDGKIKDKFIYPKDKSNMIFGLIEGTKNGKFPPKGLDVMGLSGITFTEVQNQNSIDIPKVIVPKFTIEKRENEGGRPRYHIRTPKKYNEEELDLIADSLEIKEYKEVGGSEFYVNYYLPKKKIDTSNSYGISLRLNTNRSTEVFKPVEPRKLGYNPPKARDLSKEMKRTQELWGAFDRGRISGYEAGYKDGKRNNLYKSFNSDYPSYDDWIEQSYKQGYDVGYLEGYDDAGGDR